MRIFDLLKSKVVLETKIEGLEMRLKDALIDKKYYRDILEKCKDCERDYKKFKLREEEYNKTLRRVYLHE